jgi:hypothetical protein
MFKKLAVRKQVGIRALAPLILLFLNRRGNENRFHERRAPLIDNSLELVDKIQRAVSIPEGNTEGTTLGG